MKKRKTEVLEGDTKRIMENKKHAKLKREGKGRQNSQEVWLGSEELSRVTVQDFFFFFFFGII